MSNDTNTGRILKDYVLPIRDFNENVILSNAIRIPGNRDIFCKRVNFNDFRINQNKMIAWAITEAVLKDRVGILSPIELDTLELLCVQGPIKAAMDYEYINAIIREYPAELPKETFELHIETLKVDRIKDSLLTQSLNGFFKSCADQSSKLSDLEQHVKRLTDVLATGYTTVSLDFKKIDVLVDEYEVSKAQTGDMRSTGFRVLDKELTMGLMEKQVSVVAGLSGMGKCLQKGTFVHVFPCGVKKVEDIVIGDLVMGPDSKPRKVLSLAHGFDDMYEVHQNRGENYTVNSKHILSVKKVGTSIRTRIGSNKIGLRKTIGWDEGGEVTNINVVDYMNQSKHWQYVNVGYRSIVDFPVREIKLDPYVLGVWVGDGNNHNQSVTNSDIEIRDYLKYYAATLGLDYTETRRKSKSYSCNIVTVKGTGSSNTFLNLLREYNLLNNKHIPNDYKYNSKEVRMQVLAGLLDTDGYLTSKIHEISTKYETLKDDILYLARSLGFYANAKLEEKCIKSINFKGMYWRIRICGYNHLIPNKVTRKKATKRNQKNNPLYTGIKIIPKGVGEYYGFELEGDGLFLLGDCTVTHNSSLTLSMMNNLSNLAVPVPVAEFALEMPNLSIMHKLVSFNSQLPINQVIKPIDRLGNDSEKSSYTAALNSLRSRNIYLNDKPSQSLADIREQTMLLQDVIYPKGGSGYIVVIIDLFGKIKEFQSSDNFARDYEKKLNELQIMTRELGVHMLLVAQINRAVSKRVNKRPTMADLKNAGALEEVSDLIFGIHRPFYDPEKALNVESYYGESGAEEEFEDEDVDKNLAEVIILKQRMGPGNKIINFRFDPVTTRFSTVSPDHTSYIDEANYDHLEMII